VPRALLLIVLLSVALGGIPASAQGGDSLLVEIRPPDAAALSARGLDVWETSPDRTLALVSATEADALRAEGRAVTLVRSFPVDRRRAAGASFGTGSYKGYAAIVADLQSVATAHPDLVVLQDLGPSWETVHGLASRRLIAARVSNRARTGTKPAVLFLAAYHAREVAAPELALRTLHLFVDGYGRDPLLTYLVDTREIWIVPVVNPDGYARVEAGAEWWRKNADQTALCGASPGTNANNAHPGVDLNRNHPYAWNAGGGASTDPCGETYQGPSAASEPETQAIQQLIQTTTFAGLVSWHSYGNLVLWPWGYATNVGSADPLLDALGGRLATLTGYRGGPGATTLYVTTGELTDWAWAVRKLPGFTIEVGDPADSPDGNPFAPPYSVTDRYWTENRAAALYLVRVADDSNRAYAPDVGTPQVVTPPGGANAAVTTAVVAGPGGAAIAAELFLDSPGAEGAGLVGALSSNGTRAAWALPLGGVAPGLHSVWVRARDAAGRWGPVQAASLVIGRATILVPLAPLRGSAS
jgi:hypothetical protein